jgi:hypothetical protein
VTCRSLFIDKRFQNILCIVWRKFVVDCKLGENKGNLEEFTKRIQTQPIRHAGYLFKWLLESVQEALGHDDFHSTLGYIDPDLTFLILNELINKELCIEVMRQLIPEGNQSHRCEEDMNRAKCEKFIEFYRTPKLIKVYFNININEIEKIFD